MSVFKNISIRSKLIIIQLLTAFMAILMCCIFFVYHDIRVFKSSSVKNKHSIAEIVGINAESALEFADQDAATSMLSTLANNPSLMNAVILDKAGRQFAQYARHGDERYSFPTDKGAEQESQQNLKPRFLISYPIIGKEFLGTVIMRVELTGFAQIIWGYVKIAAFILFAGVLIAFLISTILQRAISKRLITLVQSTREVTQTSNYSIRASDGGADEIGVLSAAFNSMLDQIEKMKKNLYDTNVELEERVKIRTAELQAANRELELKSEELTRSNEELGQYAYVASHDLQEPLRTITNYVGLLKEKYNGQLDKETEMYISFVVRSANTMKNLIRQLLDFSRIGRNISFEKVDCNALLQDVLDGMQQSITDGNVTIKTAGLPVITANYIGLKQLFQNIISNAVKFRKKDIPAIIEIGMQEKPGEWLFTITDNGIGMERKYLDKIFIIFQRLNSTSEYPGTGIGLATCKKIALLHQGTIWVESEVGKGSKFYFTISKNINNT